MRPLFTTAAATATNVRWLRRTLRHWLVEALNDEPDVVEDLTLASSEALENAADHAFAGTAAVGTMCLEATDDGDRITIVVSDDGHWQAPDSEAGYRGRGIDLMHRLTHISRVRPNIGGTSVTLAYHRIPTSRSELD